MASWSNIFQAVTAGVLFLLGSSSLWIAYQQLLLQRESLNLQRRMIAMEDRVLRQDTRLSTPLGIQESSEGASNSPSEASGSGSVSDTPTLVSSLESNLSDHVDRDRKPRLSPLRGGTNFDLYKGWWTGPDYDESQMLAIKELRTLDRSANLASEWKSILPVTNKMRGFTHPNIAPFFGVCFDFGEPGITALVSVYCPNHDLEEYLPTNPGADKLQLVCQIASGLSYLHRRNFVHGDVKPTNILIDRHGQACLSDFGVVPLLQKFHEKFAQSTTSLLYWPKETQVDSGVVEISKESDVWSFGLTALKASFVLSGKDAFPASVPKDIPEDVTPEVTTPGTETQIDTPDDVNRSDPHMKALVGIADEDATPNRSYHSRVPNNIWSVLERCWEVIPSNRLESTKVALLLDLIAAHRWLSVQDIKEIVEGRAASSLGYQEIPSDKSSEPLPYACNWQVHPNCEATSGDLSACQEHELAHLSLGQKGRSDGQGSIVPLRRVTA
ncbi:hypothetical protein JAAARDRAFT_192838 [Jaapia argillacea MUCL 33604]|uniref:Protein kinase domain-containing protein n=1 Tax=Jaapia argillacea MUCL 33604 TaxID=933084 RepID=A0A067Q9S9_9AGAM|nr:hypothetical protein JAAARDRAFT_192838 [Jaapia argillacea MUCL 33604]